MQLGKKKGKLGDWPSPSSHSQKWDEKEHKAERMMARGKDDGYRIQWGYDPGKKRKKSILDGLRGK